MRLYLFIVAVILAISIFSAFSYSFEYEQKEAERSSIVRSAFDSSPFSDTSVQNNFFMSEKGFLSIPERYPESKMLKKYGSKTAHYNVSTYEIRLKTHSFIPNPIPVGSVLSDIVISNNTYYLVQFYEEHPAFKSEFNSLVSEGAVVLSYWPDSTYVLRIPETSINGRVLFSVRWIGIMDPSLKIDPSLENDMKIFDMHNVSISFFEAVDGETIKKVMDLSENIVVWDFSSDHARIIAPKKNIEKLAQLNFVKYLNVFRQGGGFLDKSTRVVSSDSVWSWNDASGITVGVLDSGIIWNHPHFSGPDRVYGTSDDNVVIYSGQDFIDGGSPEAQCHPDDPYWCAGAHGVRTASVISGTGNFQGRLIQGNSYKASLTIVRILDSASYLYNNMESDGPWLSALDPDNDNNLWEDNSSDVLSNSWGEPDWGQYTELARQADRVVFGELGRPVLAIQATGNWYNLVGVPASAKNVLAVGASADYRSSNNACGDGFGQADPNNLYVMNYSNRGTVDGRVKPDLLAPGSDITMANMSGDYRSDDGTSFAAPHVSAAAQILKTFGNISPAMLKTFLIARAVGGGTTNSPNINQGWGRLNALRPHGIFADDFHYSYRDGILNNNDPNVPATVSWPISIPSGTNLLAVTMAYTDKPADVPVNQALVRKIDLYLIYPNSTKIFQNDDNVNNVEKYVVHNPVAGEWRAVLNVTRVEGFWGVGKNTSYGIVFNVIKPSRTPRINVQLTPSTFQPPLGVPFTLYADVTSEGLTSYDIWADLDIPSGISLLTLPLDGMDADKDIIGDLVADALRQSKQWSLRGDTPGIKTITVYVRGRWINGTSFEEAKTVNIDVGGTNCDYDGDGHQSLQCGGDDCNDNNANVYPGHVEWCDGIDNDCDNDIDEGCGV